MSPTAIVAASAAGLALTFAAVWLWQLRTANAGMIDAVWAAALGCVAVFAAFAGSGAPLNRLLVAAGGGVWGVRLAIHLWRRNSGKPEDARYRQFRDQWGAAAPRNFFWFFQLQALVALLLAVAFFVPAFSTRAASPVNAAGAIAVWLVAVAGEALADQQLARYTADARHRNHVCRTGLWRYSRHPNYFFECVHWLAYTVLALRLPWGWLTFAPPLLMAWLLMKVSGIPLLEAPPRQNTRRLRRIHAHDERADSVAAVPRAPRVAPTPLRLRPEAHSTQGPVR